jgi:hypothetical protein
MFLDISPSIHRRFISEEGKREHLAGLVDALEPFDRNETVNCLEQRPQLGGKIEIAFLVLRSWPNLENHGDHLTPAGVDAAAFGVSSVGCGTAR